jgi:hypothetical protein
MTAVIWVAAITVGLAVTIASSHSDRQNNERGVAGPGRLWPISVEPDDAA